MTALDNVSKRLEENSTEHTLIRAEIAEVKVEVAAVKVLNPDKRVDDYINSERGWKMLAVGQVVAILAMVGSALIWGSALSERVINIKANQVNVMQDIEELKITSPEYREFKLHKPMTNLPTK